MDSEKELNATESHREKIIQNDYCQVRESEIIREIFEEIDKELKAALDSKFNCRTTDDNLFYRIQGKIDALRGIEKFIAACKYKYMTEQKKNFMEEKE